MPIYEKEDFYQINDTKKCSEESTHYWNKIKRLNKKRDEEIESLSKQFDLEINLE